MSLPAITFEGNLTADPEIAYGQNGKARASFTVACNQKSKNDQYPDKTAFMRCTAWGALGENLAAKFSKGQRIAVTRGDLEERKYQTQEGENRYSWEVTVWGAADPVNPFPNDSQGGGQQKPNTGNTGGGFGSAVNEEVPF